MDPSGMGINGAKMTFALSPLLLLGYILFTAFESEEVEAKKRNKKTDFNMAGHSE
eukprot:CAMPEP_0172356114 /NCGR_PEP_ID=MMETSP1060-20121228/446_1 /TAXON_ID=37318 /ORGANISM="Pseudo-nitzschia pungens, Strain cf. cingulata" /LENGTH=54 /DNA_ID=CAMNT_0013076039 /DNA_START=115 /DNA_END=280 /DNA_ORIENTATION=+